MGKGQIIGLILGLFLVGGGVTYYILNNQTPPKQVQNQEFKTEVTKDSKEVEKKDTSSNYDKSEIFSTMHEMSNTLIVARDGQVWGEIPINEQSITEIEEMVVSNNNLDEKEESRILGIIESWKKGDFSNGVDDHNYFWDKLGGNIGRAKALKSEYKK